MSIRTYSHILLLCIILLCSCKKRGDKLGVETTPKHEPTNMVSPINPENFEQVIDGDSIHLYILRNKFGLQASFTNFGQRLISLSVPDKNRVFADVVLGRSSLKAYNEPGTAYFGATIGRYGNRIAGGKFALDSVHYPLAKNNGPNHLHGGNQGYDNVVWTVDHATENEIQFSRLSPDGEEGYPGNLMVQVLYQLTDEGELKIYYKATTDKKTIVNLTHHSFFNLKGEGEGTIDDHIVEINANHYTPVNENLIPTGEIASVSNTPMDFTTEKLIGKDIALDVEQLRIADGYDHNFVLNAAPLNGEGLKFAARVTEPLSGRVLEVYTSEPGIQFYSGNFLDGSVMGKNGKPYLKRGAFCLETQHYPNSPNQANFPSTILEPTETYTSSCIYKFSTEQ